MGVWSAVTNSLMVSFIFPPVPSLIRIQTPRRMNRNLRRFLTLVIIALPVTYQDAQISR